jgi:hypothetical protein
MLRLPLRDLFFCVLGQLIQYLLAIATKPKLGFGD